MEDLARPPAVASELYLARGVEVSSCRPVMTGDVFADVEIPGVEGGAGLALVLMHPCSMRDGAHLRDHLTMCAVRKGAPILPDHWLGNFGVMPLPDLVGDGGLKHRAVFELAGRVPAKSLDLATRTACLGPRGCGRRLDPLLEQVRLFDDRGIVFLLQRLAFSNTRVAVDLETIHKSIEHVLEEANLLEQWIESTTASPGSAPDHTDITAAEATFDALMQRVDPGTQLSNRDMLRKPMTRAAVRRSVVAELRNYAPRADAGG